MHPLRNHLRVSSGRLSRRILVLAVATFIAATAFSTTAVAQGFDIQQFHPIPDQQQSFFAASSADVQPHRHWTAGALMNFAYAPLVVIDDSDEARVNRLVSTQSTLHLLASIGLFDFLEIGADIPIVVYQGGDGDVPDQITPVDTGPGIGDFRLVPRVQLYTNRAGSGTDGIAIAAVADTHVPTGSSDSLQGGDFRVGPRLAVDAIVEGIRFGTNLGYQFRPARQRDNLQVDDTIGWSLFGEVPVHDTTRITAELNGKVTPTAGFDRDHSPTELLVGAKTDFRPTYLIAGAGMGVINGYGTPDWRGFLGVGVPMDASQPTSRLEPTDSVPCDPGTVDTDCTDVPDPECVGGAIRRYSPDCDDGFCSYTSVDDECGDDEICEESGDTVACVDAPECQSDGDCTDDVPEPACREGLVVTFHGRCDDGTCRYDETESSCEEGFVCGSEDGTTTCVPDPDLERAQITDEEDQIELNERVLFNVDSAEIKSESHIILDDVADLLRDNPQLERVRIEGHTDSQGTREHNLELSRHRAEAVMDYLIDQGIDADRLTAEGFGFDQPLESNDTEEGRRRNRRVEFHIVERD